MTFPRFLAALLVIVFIGSVAALTLPDDETVEITVQQTAPNLPIELSSQCVNPGPPRVDVWRLDLRYPASESPVLIRFRDGFNGPILFDREFITPGNYRDLVIGADTLVAARVIDGVETDKNAHRADHSTPCKPPETTTTTPTTVITTPPSSTTPTVPGEEIFVSAVGTTCQRDIPVITIEFGNQSELNGHTGTLTFIDLRGQVIDVRPVTYRAGETQIELYPGASVDPATGEATDWPGWVQNSAGFWIEDPSDALWREGLVLVIDINPTASTTISYPPASTACNSPENPSGPPDVIPPAR